LKNFKDFVNYSGVICLYHQLEFVSKNTKFKKLRF